MRGPWGPVYGPIDVDIESGGVTVLVCPPGSGRTALLMTLAGRMRPVSGQLTVLGRSRARDIFAHAALYYMDGAPAASPALSVCSTHLRGAKARALLPFAREVLWRYRVASPGLRATPKINDLVSKIKFSIKFRF